MVEEAGRETPGQGRFSQTFEAREEQSLGDALALDHAFERGLNVKVAPESIKHGRPEPP